MSIRTNEIKNFRGEKFAIDNDYTAWEVYANNGTIPVGSSSVLGGNVSMAILPQMTESFKIRTNLKDEAVNDVIIDWGDGSFSKIREQDYLVKERPQENDGTPKDEYNYTFEHTYTNQGKYIIKVYGKDYFSINHAVVFSQGNSEYGKNLMCRCFDIDLPIASHVTNISSFCVGARRLLNVTIPPYNFFRNVKNFARCFFACRNLLSVTGFGQDLESINNTQYMFSGCVNMTTCDFVFPSLASRDSQFAFTFDGCTSLSDDVSSFIPTTGFANERITINSAFLNCSSLTGTVPASLLWERADKIWHAVNMFTGCSDAIRSQVPVSWGGSNTNIIIPEMVVRTDIMPPPSATYENKVFLYTGKSDNGFVSGKSYKCVNSNAVVLGRNVYLYDWDNQYIDSETPIQEGEERGITSTRATFSLGNKINVKEISLYLAERDGNNYTVKFYGRNSSEENYTILGQVYFNSNDYDESTIIQTNTENYYEEYLCEIGADFPYPDILNIERVKLSYVSGNDYVWREVSVKSDKIDTVSNIKAYVCSDRAFFLWEDPDDKIIVNQEVVAEWGKTVLVGKKGGFPLSPSDGDYVIESTVFNQYKDSPLMVQSLDGRKFDMSYKWRWFTYTKFGVVNDDSNSVKSLTDFTWEELKMMIDESNASSYNLKQYFQLGDVVTVDGYDWQVADINMRGMRLVGYKGLDPQVVDAVQKTIVATGDKTPKREDYCLLFTYATGGSLNTTNYLSVATGIRGHLFYLTEDNTGADRVWRTLDRGYEIKYQTSESNSSANGFKLIDRASGNVLFDWSQLADNNSYSVNVLTNVRTEEFTLNDELSNYYDDINGGYKLTQDFSDKPLKIYYNNDDSYNFVTATLYGRSNGGNWQEIDTLTPSEEPYIVDIAHVNYDEYRIEVGGYDASVALCRVSLRIELDNSVTYVDVNATSSAEDNPQCVYYPNYFVEESNSKFVEYTGPISNNSLNRRTVNGKVYKRIYPETQDSNSRFVTPLLLDSNRYDGWAGGVGFNVSQSSMYSSAYAYNCMNGMGDTSHTNYGKNHWWQIKFDSPVRVVSFKRTQDNLNYSYAKQYTLSASNDEDNWTQLYSFDVSDTNVHTYDISNSQSYIYYRIFNRETSNKYMIQNRIEFEYIPENMSDVSFVSIGHTPHNLIANPTLANNGMVFSASSTDNDTGILYALMDGLEIDTCGGSSFYFQTKNEEHPWFSVEFQEPKQLFYLTFGTKNNSSYNPRTQNSLILQYSDNGSDWVDGGDFTINNSKHRWNTIVRKFNNGTPIYDLGEHKYWRIYSKNRGCLVIGELEFGWLKDAVYEYQPDITLQRTTGGGNDYENSELDQYLNFNTTGASSVNLKDVFVPATPFQKFSGFNGKVFQEMFNEDFLSCVCETEIEVFAGICPNGKHKIKRKFYIPSATEMGRDMTQRYTLGKSFALFKGSENNVNKRRRLKKTGSGYVNYWTRTAIGTPKRYGIIMTNGNYGSLDARGNNDTAQSSVLASAIPVCTIGKDYISLGLPAEENLMFYNDKPIENKFYPINQNTEGGFTLSFMVKDYNSLPYDFISMKDGNAGNEYALVFQRRCDGCLEIETGMGSFNLNSYDRNNMSYSYDLFLDEESGKWDIGRHNIIVSFDNSSLDAFVYVDGSLLYHSCSDGQTFDIIPFFCSYSDLISNVCVWSRPLSGEEVNEVFNVLYAGKVYSEFPVGEENE